MVATSVTTSSKSAFSWVAPVFVFFWSTGFIIAKFGMAHAEPMTFLFFRFFGVLICMVPIIIYFRPEWPSKVQILHLGVSGALLQFGYLGAVWVSVRHGMPAGLSSLIVGLQPLLTAILASLIAERVTARQWAGLLLGLVGVIFVLNAKLHTDGVNFFNVLINIAGLVGITVGTMYQKKYCPQFDLRTGSFIQFTVSSVLAGICALAFESMHVDWTIEMIGALVWGVLVISIGAMSLLFKMIRTGNATKVSSIIYLTPPTTAILAWIIFNEPLTPGIIFGTFLAALGVMLVNQALPSEVIKSTEKR